MTPYERLDAWKLAHRLVLETYRISSAFPPSERFGLTNQLRRAAFSVAANIAEGSARESQKEYLHFAGMLITRGLPTFTSAFRSTRFFARNASSAA